MTNGTGITLNGGYAASHPVAPLLPILVAPSTRVERNVIRQELVTVACWRLNDLRFDFDSSFVMPAAASVTFELILVTMSSSDSAETS
jgi:hypothetical protein